jgi:hypothetical protein
MRGVILATWAAALSALTGCASLPLADNPIVIRPEAEAAVENPVFVPLGPPSYATVFEKVLTVLDDYFEIAYMNRYDGRIETFPRIAPGYEQPWKASTPDCYERLRATLQTIRHRAIVQIQPANDGGFFIKVTVFKELEDLARPAVAYAAPAAFRTDQTVERQYEVIDPTVLDSAWIPLGEDAAFEQLILQRLKKCM